MTVFYHDEDRRRYLLFLSEEIDRFGVSILAWCLMPNHVHFIAVPHEKTSLAKAFGEAHRRYTRSKNFAEGVRGYLFQGRFHSVVLDEKHLIAAARYVELNPVRANLVRHASDYPWSSTRFNIGLCDNDPLVRKKMLPELLGNWEKFLKSGEDEEANALRLATRTGRPAGDDAFISRIKDITGRNMLKKKPGRPRKKHN